MSKRNPLNMLKQEGNTLSERIIDLIFGTIVLLLTFPLFLLTSLIIKLDSRGPVFYRAPRIGKNGSPFTMMKFRTLVENAESIGAATTTKTDPRMTRIGRIIRPIRIDELPQLFNVFRGEMSLVGPRPEVKKFVDLFTQEERAILTVRPGMTDWASLFGYNLADVVEGTSYADADAAYFELMRPAKLRYQLEYVRRHNAWINLQIMFATAITLILRIFGGPVIGVPDLQDAKGKAVLEEIRAKRAIAESVKNE